MEVRKSFPKQVKALAESTPREAIANLLSALMPRVAVQTKAPRAYTPPPTYDDWGTPSAGQPDPMAKLQRKRAPRTRSANRSYEVLRPTAYANHKRSWRRAMVQAAVNCASEQEALSYLTEIWGEGHKYVKQGIDFAWCAAQGYIKY